MELTKVVVYRLKMAMKCGCQATAEYSDTHYTQTLVEPVFTACEKHTNQPGVDLLAMMLVEALEKEARDLAKAPAPSATHAPVAAEEVSTVLPKGVEVAAGGGIVVDPAPRAPLGKSAAERGRGERPVVPKTPKQFVREHPQGRLTEQASIDMGDTREDPRLTNLLETVDSVSFGEKDDND